IFVEGNELEFVRARTHSDRSLIDPLPAKLVIACAARKCGVERNLCAPCSLFAADGSQCLAGPNTARLACRFGNPLAPRLASYSAPHAAADKCLRREAGAADVAAASPWAAGLLFAVLLGVLLLCAALSRRAVSAPPGTINGPQSGLPPSDRRIVITLELIVFEHQLPRNSFASWRHAR
ncbi:MAG: hypothetical protein ACM3PO_06990, partial [Betaproteobacteria bacterium]